MALTTNDTPSATPVPPPHLLARELARRIAAPARVLHLGVGSGRNISPFVDRDVRVDALETDAGRAAAVARRFANDSRVRVVHVESLVDSDPAAVCGRAYDGALSTHALLHGRLGDVVATVAAARALVRVGAPLYATFGSTRDPRFGAGTQLDAATFAPIVGPEAGIAHTFFDQRGIRALLDAFKIETLVETDAAEYVGTWAHAAGDAASIVHWFVRAVAR